MGDEYQFSLSFHSDVVLSHESTIVNLGYLAVARFPVSLWAHHLEIFGKNVFSGFESSDAELDEELTDLVCEVKVVADKMPMTRPAFKEEMGGLGLSYFDSGSFNSVSSFELSQKGIYLGRTTKRKNPEVVLTLDEEESTKLMQSYVQFAKSTDKLGKYQTLIPAVINELIAYQPKRDWDWRAVC